jgi:hypothetical protein
MDACVRQLEQLALDGLVGPMLAKVHEIIPSYAGHLNTGQPWVLHLNPESRKPLATAPPNGPAPKRASSRSIERGA